MIKFANNAEGILTAGVAIGALTTMELTAGDGLLFPTVVYDIGVTYFYVTLVTITGTREIIKVTEHQAGTDVFQKFVRAQDGTSALAFEIGDKVQMRPSAIMFNTFRDDIAANNVLILANTAKSTADEQVLYGPSGLVMYIYNPVAEVPTGWSLHAGPADCLLAVAGGSNAYNVVGETLAGTWTRTGHVHGQPAHTHTGPSHTHTGPSHTHTGPSHSHSLSAHTHTGPSHTHTGTSHLHQWYGTGGVSGSDTTFNPAGNSVSLSSFNNQGRIKLASFTGTIDGSEVGKVTSDMYTNLGGAGTSGAGGTGATAGPNSDTTNAAGTGATAASGTAATGASGTAATSSNGSENTTNSKDPITDRPYAAVGFLIERD